MNCLDVRERLPERALHPLADGDETTVARHLEWCAGCRKEDTALRAAAASLALALPPVDPPEDLEERVVERVRQASGRTGGRRRAWTVAASLAAAAVAVSALGWGSVMAGKAERAEERAQVAIQREEIAIARFEDVIRDLGVEAREDETRSGRLTAPEGRDGAGVALVLVSPDDVSFAIVQVKGLDPERAPYDVSLLTSRGVELEAGRITRLDADRGDTVILESDRDLSHFGRVVVRDAEGDLALEGEVRPRQKLRPGASLGLR